MSAPTHFLLDRRAGWREQTQLCAGIELMAGQLRLQPLPGAPQPLTDASGTFGGLVDPAGVATGADGTIVILDSGGTRVLRYDPCDGAFAPIACMLAVLALDHARDITITRDGDVAIADTGNRRVLTLVGAGLGVRRVIGPWTATATEGVQPVAAQRELPAAGGCAIATTWPAQTWEPWGVAAWRGGMVVSDHANGLVHFLDGDGHWLRSSDGSGPETAALVAPTAIAVDRSGNVYVLQEGAPTVRVLDPAGAWVADLTSLDAQRRAFCPVAVAISPTGQLCVGGGGGELCVFTAAEDPCDWAAGSTQVDAPVTGLAFDPDGNPVLSDAGQGCMVRLRNGAGYPAAGRFVTVALDSGASGCRWHRVSLRGCVPQGTNIRVDTLTAESTMDPAEVIALADERWATGQLVGSLDPNGWDCLIRSDPGRYLRLSLTLSGDGASTPVLSDIEVWFPRSTSAEYLPRAFRGEPGGGDFLERFLSISDSQRDGVIREIDAVAGVIDPMASPANADGSPDFLGWLAGWVGMAFDLQLPVERRRTLVREAAALYRIRGKPEGVQRFVSLFCGVEVKLLEQYRLRRWAITDQSRLGDTTELFGDGIVKRLQLGEYSRIGSFELIDTDDPRHDPFLVYASRFTLLLLARPTAQLLALAQAAADLAKPAHTLVEIETVEPRQRVGIQCTVGLDTVIAEVPAPGRTGSAQLGQGVVVGPDPRLGGRRLAQIGLRSQVGVNTGLE